MCKVDEKVGNSCSTATSTMSLNRNAIPSANNTVIDLTEDEDKMVQVANISSSWEDTADDAEKISMGNEITSAEEAERSTDTGRVVIEDHEKIDQIRADNGAITFKAKRTNTSKGIKKAHQTFSFQDKVDLIDAMKYEYEMSKSKGVLATNPWKKILTKLHPLMYDDWDEIRLWRMWSQMRLSAKIHTKDGSDYVDAEVWKLLEKHSNYLKKRKNVQQNLKRLTSLPPGEKSDHQQQQNLIEESDKLNDKVPEASINSPSKTVQTLISSYCKVDNFDEKITFQTKAQISSPCAEQANPNTGDVKKSATLKANTSQTEMDILTIEIDSDSDSNDENNASSDPAVKVPLSPVKNWTESEKNTFFKSVKVEFGAMLKNNEKISNPWKTIIERLHKSQYSMYSFKELDKVWRKIRMDAHLHENNNAMLIKLLHTIKEAKRTSKLTNAKSAEKLGNAHDLVSKNTSKSKPGAPEKKKRKKRPLTLSRMKKDKKPKLALPPLDPNKLEEDKDCAERTEWSEKEQSDLISIVETTGNEVFKPDDTKQFWHNVRKNMIEKGHSERKENEGTKDSSTSSLSGEITKDSQQSELHSVEQNKSDKTVICNRSSVNRENSEQCTVQEIGQEDVKSDGEEEIEDDESESEDEYVLTGWDILEVRET
nr:unnamed protein product [Callosobruchus analis]